MSARLGTRAGVVLGLLLLAPACAQRIARRDPLADRFADADARRAQQLAPDLHARAARAHVRALRADDADPGARAEHERAAGLLLDAAIAAAERIEHERAAAAAEARATTALQERAAFEARRRAAVQQTKAELTARTERAEAARVFDGAQAGDPQSTAFLLRRARLTLATALALGLAEERAAEVGAKIAAVEGAARPAPGAARAALHDADRALGEARALREPAAAAALQAAALVELAGERGLPAQATAGGARLDLTALFAAGSAELTASGRRRLAELASVAAAHPHGPIRIEYAPGASGDLDQRRARARADRIRGELAKTAAKARVQLSSAPSSAATGDAVHVVFEAYASGS